MEQENVASVTAEDKAWETHGDNYVPWKKKTTKEKLKTVLVGLAKTILLLICLYLFICSLVLMAEALNVLAGRVAVNIFTSDVFLSNPATGLIIGILVTVIIQSSSTTTSIIIAMVATEVISVAKAIPIVMGANIGTSVTNTAVALTLSMKREQFRKAFAGATVHDCFNILSVAVFLPIEAATGYLEALTKAIISSIGKIEGTGAPRFLRTLTEPIVDHLIHVNKTVQIRSSRGQYLEDDNSLVSIWCERSEEMNKTFIVNTTSSMTVSNNTVTATAVASNFTGLVTTENRTVIVGIRKCDTSDFLFAATGMSEAAVGTILFIISLVVLIGCLLGMVKILTSLLQGAFKQVIRKAVNTNFPKPFGWLSSYVAVLVGGGVTMLIQSSSVVTSTLTPLVGLDVVKLKRMYAVTVGANMGTTTTAVLAALATGSSNALQTAFCHFFFNVSGFIIWYILPFMRKVPLEAATGLGNITAKYRWFSVFYIITLFFIIPAIILGLSFAPLWFLATVLITAAVIIVFIIVINVLQRKRPSLLPAKLRTWDFLPLFLHSFKPMDRFIQRYFGWCRCCRCCYRKEEQLMEGRDNPVYENGDTEV